MAPSDGGCGRAPGLVHQARRALVQRDQAGLPPGLGRELRRQTRDPRVEHPVQPRRPGLGEVQQRECVRASAHAARSKPSKPAVPRNRPSTSAGEVLTPASARLDRVVEVGQRAPAGARARDRRPGRTPAPGASAGPARRRPARAARPSSRASSASPRASAGVVGVAGRPHQRRSPPAATASCLRRRAAARPRASSTARAVATGTPCRNATPSFAPNVYGARPASRSRSVAGSGRHPPTSSAVADAGEEAAEVCQRDDLAGRAVAGRGHAPASHVGVEQGDQRRAQRRGRRRPPGRAGCAAARRPPRARVRRSSQGAPPTARASIRSPWKAGWSVAPTAEVRPGCPCRS